MFHINNNNPRYHQRISDLGGQQILGMSGSLRAYIETGNPHDKAFFRGREHFYPNNKRKQKDHAFLKGFVAATAAIGGVAGIAALLKKGGSISGAFKLAKDGIISAWTKITGKNTTAPKPNKVKDFFSNIGNKIKGLFVKTPPTKPKPPKGKTKGFFKNIGTKIKGIFKKTPKP